MSYSPNLLTGISLDAGGRLRTSQLTTLGDLKTLNEDDTLLLENTGTGTFTWADNKCNLSVTTGQYAIRRSRHYFPYFSGKSQPVEVTFDGFQTQAGVTKRVGYFSSNAVAPYDSNKDGFWIEDDGTTKYIVVSRYGTETHRTALANWNGDKAMLTYDWSKFTVVWFDFLWLGGAELRVFVKTGEGFVLAHSYSNHPGVSTNTFTKSPNQCVRYEVRGDSDAGSLRAICAQVSTEGSINESGKQRSIDTTHTAITLAAIGTTYPIIGLRKKTTHRDRAVKQIGVAAFVGSTDSILLSLQRNPTLSAPLTWSDVTNSAAQQGLATGAQTVTTPGEKLFARALTQNVVIPPNILDNDFLSSIGMSIADVSDELILCGTPITATVSVTGIIGFKEY
jgi:hypothetical protein